MRIQNGDVIMDDAITPLTKLQKGVAQLRQGLKRTVSKADVRLEAMAAEAVLAGLDSDHTNMPTNSLHPHHQPHVSHVPHIVHSPKLQAQMRKQASSGSPPSSPISPTKSGPGLLANLSPYKKSSQVKPFDLDGGESPDTSSSVMSPTRASQAKRVSKDPENVRFHP
jgi:hypothetical protein